MILRSIIIVRNHLISKVTTTSNDNFNFRKIENISLSQQTYIANINTNTNTETINYVNNNCLNNAKIATIIVNPTPSLNELFMDS